MRSLPVLLYVFVTVNAYVRLPFATVPSSRRAPSLKSAVSPSDMENYSNAETKTENVVSWDWQQVATSVFEEDERPIILFDGLCNLCNGGVNFALDHDPKGALSLSYSIMALSSILYSLTFTFLYKQQVTFVLFPCRVKWDNRYC